MKQHLSYSVIGGLIIFVLAVLLWKPGPGLAPMDVPPAEHRRGIFWDVTRAGEIIFAAGEHGRILYSGDEGYSWTLVRTPVDLPLTKIYFFNEMNGWAVGHDGVILRTVDGGLSWNISQSPEWDNPPLFDIWFHDPQVGIAVGADSSIYRTTDGGLSWNLQKMQVQAHLYTISVSGNGVVWVAGENNALYRSDDQGVHWKKIKPPLQTSFFGSVALSQEEIMVFGLRGRVMVWNSRRPVLNKAITEENLFAGTLLRDKIVVLAGQRGKILWIGAGDSGFRAAKFAPPGDISDLVETSQGVILAGEFGLLPVSRQELGF